MCYSALVEQDLRKLARGFKARIDEASFLDLFKTRNEVAEKLLEGHEEFKTAKVSITKDLETHFLDHSESATSKEIKTQIMRWWELEEHRLNETVQLQSKRVELANQALQKKSTKKAENDVRIGTNKVRDAKSELDWLRKPSKNENGSWISPKFHFPGVCVDKERVILPFRYLIRPAGQPASFDLKYDGAYNAQQERIEEVFFWRELLGRQHGYFQVYRFKERQDDELIAGNRKEFEFNPGVPMIVPFLWDHWSDPAKVLPELRSAAAITCKPPKEVLDQGVRRLLTPLKDSAIASWESTSRENFATYKALLADYQWEKLEFSEIA